MSKKEEKAKEYIHDIFNCKMCDDEFRCIFGVGCDCAEDCDCTADDCAEGFKDGWQAAMEYLHSLPIRESILEICKESKGGKQ